MPSHRSEPRRLPLGAAGFALVLALWCAGDAAAPTAVVLPGAGATTVAGPVPASTAFPAPRPAAGRPASGSSRTSAAQPGPRATSEPRGPATPNPAAAPVAPPARLVAERIGLDDEPMELGRRADRTLEVPPEAPGSPAGWYRDSPAPGRPGPAVFLGHVNATGGGPGVFAGLHLLVPGDEIQVQRRDGSRVVFVVRDVQRYAKNAFPSLRVYGNTVDPELRLITCDGYDPETGSFDENLVVYAALADR